MNVLIAVLPALKGGLENKRKQVQNLIAASGLKASCKNVRTLYRLEGRFGLEETHRIARELLCDPVAEKFDVDAVPEDGKTYFADVWFKPGVTDPVGGSVVKAIGDLKISSVEKASSGTRYEFTLAGAGNSPDASLGAIVQFVNKELLNPLIQECKVTKL